MSVRQETYLAHQLLSLVTSHFDISLKELICGKSGTARLARGSAVYAIRKHASLPFTSIAALFGLDTTEAAWYVLRLHEVDMQKNPHLQRVQHLIDDFVAASVDLQLPSEVDSQQSSWKEVKADTLSNDTAWLLDEILDDFI